MADPKFPYVRWRDGRPRSSHGQVQRARGFVDEDLKHPDGRWFTMEEAAAFSDRRVKEVKQSLTEKRKAIAKPPAKHVTVDHLLTDWVASDEFKAMRQNTRTSYEKCINAIRFRPETRAEAAKRRKQEKAAAVLGMPAPQREREPMADVTPSSLGKPELRSFFNYLVKARGDHMALAAISTLSAAISWGCESTLWRLKNNPRVDMVFTRPAGRIVLVDIHEFQAWVAASDAIERPSLGDSFYLALFTGQRQADRLPFKFEQSADGRYTFRQSKTNELVDIKSAPQLTARCEDARRRIGKLKLKLGLRDMPAELIINESNGQTYDASTYRHWIAATRNLAVFGMPVNMTPAGALTRAQKAHAALRAAWPAIEMAYPLDDQDEKARQRALDERRRVLADWLADRARQEGSAGWRLAPCPTLLFVNSQGELDAKHDQDLRDTCVMLLDRSGCDLLTICDITGHSYKSAQTIVKHYRARNAARADTGIDRLELQVRKEGMAG